MTKTFPLDGEWLFGGKLRSAATEVGFVDQEFSRITLPHTVAQLSWQNWDPAQWEDGWIYRQHFAVPKDTEGKRLFLHFERVMAGAAPVLNGHALEPHLGGFLPFEREITGLTKAGDNLLAVVVDGRWLNVPPTGGPKGEPSVDYLLPAGITGTVELRVVPETFLREVFAKPVDVLSENRRLHITCRVNGGEDLPTEVRISAELGRDSRKIATAKKTVRIDKGDQDVELVMDGLSGVELWDAERPHLYDIGVTLSRKGQSDHTLHTRIGFREARFELDGFYLNGKRTQLFGLDRHEHFPYLGFAAPNRLQRRDAEILRKELNCNMVRCSHYPQSGAFLDACDELGLMVWEELPGWQYIGDESWRDLAVRDVEGMIRRDRNRPSIIIWGTRINESENDPEFYRRTRALAKRLDDSRPTSGTMTPSSRRDWKTQWNEDVFAFDDYHADPVGQVGILEPVEGHPYMLAEVVGQFNYRTGKKFDVRYRRAGDITQQMDQAIFHAQAHDKTAANKRIAGALAWCAFDYGSLMNAYHAVKCPGLADLFRLPKLGASFYRSQIDPVVRPVIEPDFYWDFGPQTPSGPGEHAAIFSNCERLEISSDGKPHATLHPDREGYPHLKYPPFFADLKMDGKTKPVLQIDGYFGGRRVLSRSFSADRSTDKLWLHADDAELVC
ncbi:MAG: glycoside hydrolase family 2 protein, partial [Acidobacteriota bacterium]|nr:glycoside hydrolase family 2 protein [Acidobacteriota bacterium]